MTSPLPKLLRLATISNSIGFNFFSKQHKILKHINHEYFLLVALPIGVRSSPACPNESGPFILRAFLHAREMIPFKPFRLTAGNVLQDVHDSTRVDGLPRVVITVHQDVAKPLRGKLHGYLRKAFRKKGRKAVTIAITQLREEKPSTFYHDWVNVRSSTRFRSIVPYET